MNPRVFGVSFGLGLFATVGTLAILGNAPGVPCMQGNNCVLDKLQVRNSSTVANDGFNCNVMSPTYGALGNDTGDDSTAINAALTACPGQTVLLPGTHVFRICSPLVMGNGQTLKGSTGEAIAQIDASCIPAMSGFPNGNKATTAAISIPSGVSAVVEDVAINCGAVVDGTTGIFVNFGNARLQRVDVTGCTWGIASYFSITETNNQFTFGNQLEGVIAYGNAFEGIGGHAHGSTCSLVNHSLPSNYPCANMLLSGNDGTNSMLHANITSMGFGGSGSGTDLLVLGGVNALQVNEAQMWVGNNGTGIKIGASATPSEGIPRHIHFNWPTVAPSNSSAVPAFGVVIGQGVEDVGGFVSISPFEAGGVCDLADAGCLSGYDGGFLVDMTGRAMLTWTQEQTADGGGIWGDVYGSINSGALSYAFLDSTGRTPVCTANATTPDAGVAVPGDLVRVGDGLRYCNSSGNYGTIYAQWDYNNGSCNQAFASGSTTVMNFCHKVNDLNATVDAGSNWSFAAPVQGLYQIDSAVRVSASSGSFTELSFQPFVNGTRVAYDDETFAVGSTATISTARYSRALLMNAGDTLQFKIFPVTSGAATSSCGNDNSCGVTIWRVPGS